MPYKIESRGNEFCVVKKDTGESVGCHPSKEKATAQLRALYANVHDSSVVEFSMAIIKANNAKDGAMRLRLTSSDVGKDYYDEQMSDELFDDFIKHIENGDEIPEPFKSKICEEEWCGGMPYMSLAHYKSGKGNVNVPGEILSVYRDGRVLKSTASLYDNPLGRAVFKSLKRDSVEKRDDKIRVSIGFLDLEHTHGEKFTFTRKGLSDKCPLCAEGVGDKIYKKGFLVHKAFTRKPANPRTDVEVERAMTTKLEDAKSIVDDEEVLESLELKSQAEDVLVIKADETPAEPVAEPVQESTVSTQVTIGDPAGTTTTINIPATPVVPQVVTSGLAHVVEPTPLEKSLAMLKDRVAVIKSQGLTGDNALREMQASVDELGNVLRTEFTPVPTPAEIANQNLEATLRSLLAEMLPQALAQSVAPMQAELSELRALSLVRQPTQKKQEEVPQPRSLNVSLVQRNAIQDIQKKSVDQFQQLANQSVGLPS